MAKYIYVGDPAGAPNRAGKVSFTNPSTGGVVTFPVGIPTEAPAWIASRLARNTHFKAVDGALAAKSLPKIGKAKQ